MFKVGDIVEITEESSAMGMLDFVDGNGYVVQDSRRVAKAGVWTGQVYLCGEGNNSEGWYAASHFKLKEDLKEDGVPEFSVGDAVICIETDFYELDVNNITYLKEYIVKRSNKGCIQIVKDSGELGWFNGDNFKLKEDAKVEKKECLFKEGQVVWDLRNGRGVVEEITNDERYPVKVRLDLKDMDGYELTDHYTADGRYVNTQTVRSLYFSEPKIEAATEPLFEPTLEAGMTIAAVDKETSCFYPVVVREETEEDIESVHSVVFKKTLYDFYRLGEKIEFN